ncbi:hypothetical protein PR202_ga19368 [Eleusine coracana subsp. coracana]|uniref:Uncharacterized protein n=1 Tax=Eleusine coracana subsp. coracana TaxID=191504 RepID=A0AAV5CVW5_ELECO|nr:hypothetical protein PR202_ga19368 [Eleusine coracana subsp. coracana]
MVAEAFDSARSGAVEEVRYARTWHEPTQPSTPPARCLSFPSYLLPSPRTVRGWSSASTASTDGWPELRLNGAAAPELETHA